jgi:hypothetical protein
MEYYDNVLVASCRIWACSQELPNRGNLSSECAVAWFLCRLLYDILNWSSNHCVSKNRMFFYSTDNTQFGV